MVKRKAWSVLSRSLVVIGLLFLSVAELGAKSSLPSWLKTRLDFGDAYDQFGEDTEALTLYDWASARYLGRGRVERTVRYAIHLKSRSERGRAAASIGLYNGSQKMGAFKAWLVFPSGKIETFDRKDGAMKASERDALQSDSMSFVLDKSASVNRDDIVFAYEYELREKRAFYQEVWQFQSSVPSLYSAIELDLPKGWRAKGQLMNADSVAFEETGRRYRWEARNLGGVDIEETSRLPNFKLSAWVGITIVPSESVAKDNQDFVFESWNDVARFDYKVQKRQMSPDKSIEAKANELVAGSTSKLEKIRAICEYTQTVNYMQINLDLNAGGGYEPHSAQEVFRRHFGDCKDMTVLTLSMLKTQGIEAYPVSASIGGEMYVHDSWASPFQFDHCIVGIPVGEDIDLPAVVVDASHGRMLIFDPTNRYTSLGYLSSSLQGTRVLVGSEIADSLTELPVGGEHVSKVSREIDATIGRNGSLRGTISERISGSASASLRFRHRTSSEDEFRMFLQSWIARGTREAKIESFEIEDDFANNQFHLKCVFSTAFYGRMIGVDTMIFKPVFLTRRNHVPPPNEKRQSDYVSEPFSYIESTRYSLEDGLTVQELPKAFAREESFSMYSIEASKGERELIVERGWQSQYEVVPSSRYAEIVDFHEKVARAEGRPIVLKISKNSP